MNYARSECRCTATAIFILYLSYVIFRVTLKVNDYQVNKKQRERV